MSMRTTTLLASLMLAGLTCAEAQTNSGSGQPSTQQDTGPAAASSPHQRHATRQGSQQEAAPDDDSAQGSVSGRTAEAKGASSPHQRQATHMAAAGGSGEISAGTPVQTRSGESLGTVVDVLPAGAGGATGRSADKGYVVVAGSGGSARPIPYAVASSMVENGKLVVDRARLEGAPTVQQSQLEDASGRSWHHKADSYWHAQQGSSGSSASGAGTDSSAGSGSGPGPSGMERRQSTDRMQAPRQGNRSMSPGQDETSQGTPR